MTSTLTHNHHATSLYATLNERPKLSETDETVFCCPHAL